MTAPEAAHAITPEDIARWRQLRLQSFTTQAVMDEYRTAVPRLLDRVEALEAAVEALD